MFKINLHLCLFIMFNYVHYGAFVNYNPYDYKQPYPLQEPNSGHEGYNAQQPATNGYSFLQQNQQGNSNYQQMYRYYYTPPYQQQHYELQSQQPTHLWSGRPIVVDDDIQQYQQSSTNTPPIFYKQHSTTSISRNSDLLPFLHRNAKVYNPLPTTRTTQFNYNNNNNIVYHRDLRQQIDAIPESQHTQQNILSWNNQQKQRQLLEQQQQQQELSQQFNATNINSRYNGISNDFISLRKGNVPDYREHFKRYLENNPHRIKPIY